MAGKPLALKAVGLASNEQGFSNCCFVSPADAAKLAAAAGVSEDDKVLKDRGVLCAVNDAVFFVKPFDRALPGTIAVGMMQRMAGAMMLDTCVFSQGALPRGGGRPRARAPATAAPPRAPARARARAHARAGRCPCCPLTRRAARACRWRRLSLRWTSWARAPRRRLTRRSWRSTWRARTTTTCLR
jgi:hypothetical protein